MHRLPVRMHPGVEDAMTVDCANTTLCTGVLHLSPCTADSPAHEILGYVPADLLW